MKITEEEKKGVDRNIKCCEWGTYNTYLEDA